MNDTQKIKALEKANDEEFEESTQLDEAQLSWESFDVFDGLIQHYMPYSGEGDTMASQLCTAVNKLIYKWFNDGDVFDNTYRLEGWANDLSSYANWIYANVGKRQGVQEILERIYEISTEDEYTQLLWDLAKATINSDCLYELENLPEKGTIYDCDNGPFKYEEYSDEDEYDDYEEDDYDYDEE